MHAHPTLSEAAFEAVLAALGHPEAVLPAPEQRTWVGLATLALAFAGALFPVAAVAALALGLLGLHQARRHRQVPDGWLGAGLIVASVFLLLWLAGVALTRLGGG